MDPHDRRSRNPPVGFLTDDGWVPWDKYFDDYNDNSSINTQYLRSQEQP